MRLSPWSRGFGQAVGQKSVLFLGLFCAVLVFRVRVNEEHCSLTKYAHQSQTAAHSITQLARFEPYVAQHKPEIIIDVILWKPSLQKPN